MRYRGILFLFFFSLSFSVCNFSTFLPLLESLSGREKLKIGLTAILALLKMILKLEKVSRILEKPKKGSKIRKQQALGDRESKWEE